MLGLKPPAWTGRWVKWASRHPYWSGYLCGIVYFGSTVSWMFGLRTAEIATGFALVIVAFSAALLMVSSFAVGFLLFIWLWRRLNLTLTDQRAWWLIPLVWVLAEYARSVFFSVAALGPGGRIGPYWNFGNVGFWLANTPLVYLARFGGLYLLSGTMALLIVTTIISVRRHDWRPVSLALAVVSLFSLLGWSLYKTPSGPSRDVVALQFSEDFNPSQFSSSTAELLASRPEHSADVVILPEYSHLWEVDPTQDTASLSRVLRSQGGLVIDSVQEKTDGGGLGHNLIAYHRPDGSILHSEQKWFSIPGGEYVPYGYQVILAYVGQDELLRHFNDQKSIEHGERHERPYIYEGVSYGAMACSASIAPDLYRNQAARGAAILTNSASLDTLGVAESYHAQTRVMARLHAIANARPFVQSARGGLSYIIDSNGHFLDQNHKKGYDMTSAYVATNTTTTPYTRFGDWIIWLAGVITAVALVHRLTTRDRKKPFNHKS